MKKTKTNFKYFFLLLVLFMVLGGCDTIKNNLTNQNMYKKIYLNIDGCYLGIALEDNSNISSFNNNINKKHALIGLFIQYLQDKSQVMPSLYSTTLATIKEQNCVPFITWEPWDASKSTKNILPDILNGTYDNLIDSWATALKTYDWPVIIRWGHEMDGNWYPWSQNSQTYKQAFQYVVTRFKNTKAHNVSWIFAPNKDNGGTGKKFEDYFPGTSYIDGLGISGYNFGTSQSWSSWITFYSAYINVITKFDTLYNLPIIIDVASSETGGNKAEWIEAMFNQLVTNPYLYNIKGFVWFNFNKETNWKIDSSQASFDAYKNGIQNSYFIGTPRIEEKTY